MSTLKLSRPVRASFQYCNLNYNVLGLVIEAASGESYADYVQKHIFAPLAMGHTYPYMPDLPYWQKHFMYGLIEVDITIARRFIEEHEARTGEQLSFTGYLTFYLARAVDENAALLVVPFGDGGESGPRVVVDLESGSRQA